MRDASWLAGLCFYIPSLFLAVCLLGFVLLYAAARRYRVGLLAVSGALGPLCFVLFVENQLVAPQPSATAANFRLVHWNVGGALHRQGMRDFLVARQADLYVLSEVPDDSSVQALRDALGPSYQAEVFGNLAVIGRGAVETKGWLLDRDRVKIQPVVWRHSEHSLLVLVVDLPSSILVPRDPLLQEVRGLIEQHRPDLVAGDFNAPRRSWALSDLPPEYAHAYHSAGAGIGYTWPVPFPLYALDQCIHSRRIVPARYTLLSSIHSDHRCQVLDFSLAGGD